MERVVERRLEWVVVEIRKTYEMSGSMSMTTPGVVNFKCYCD